MRILVEKRMSSGKIKKQLVDMKPGLYKYLSKKKSNGTFGTDKAIRQAGIVNFRKARKSSFGKARKSSFGKTRKSSFGKDISNVWWPQKKRSRKFSRKSKFGVWDWEAAFEQDANVENAGVNVVKNAGVNVEKPETKKKSKKSQGNYGRRRSRNIGKRRRSRKIGKRRSRRSFK